MRTEWTISQGEVRPGVIQGPWSIVVQGGTTVPSKEAMLDIIEQLYPRPWPPRRRRWWTWW